MEQRTRRGACRSNQASVKPHFSSVPNLKLSMSTSDFSIRPARTFCPAGTAMLSVSERLLRLTPRKYTASLPTKGGPQLRVSSPLSGGSTLITSAPMSPSIMVQSGPARIRVKSTTRMPASGPLAVSVISAPVDSTLLAHRGRRVEVLGAAIEIVLELALVAHAEFLEVG